MSTDELFGRIIADTESLTRVQHMVEDGYQPIAARTENYGGMEDLSAVLDQLKGICHLTLSGTMFGRKIEFRVYFLPKINL